MTKEAGGVVAGRRGRRLHQRLKTPPRRPRGGSGVVVGSRDGGEVTVSRSRHVTEALCSRDVPELDTGPQAAPSHGMQAQCTA